MDIPDKVKEAEAYRSMGLLEESILAYEKILSSENAIKDEDLDLLESTVAQIRKELENLETPDENVVTAEEIAIAKETLSLTDEAPNHMDSASAFMELGLYKDALAEYERILIGDHASNDIFNDLATCLLKCCGPSEILRTVQRIVAKSEIDDHDKAEIQFRIGLEMQQRDLKMLARDLCCAAKKSDPDNEEIRNWLNTNNVRRQLISRYDHLVIRKRVTPKQLQKALEQSKKTQKSIEFILIHHFEIKPEELGRSLSLYYHCPFRQYDPNLIPPHKLIRDLKKMFLLNLVND